MPLSRLVVLDFDSTLFDLPGFVSVLPTAFAAEFGVGADSFAAEIKQFYVDATGYDIYAHALKHGVDLAKGDAEQRFIERILSLYHEQTGRPDLLFPDARTLLERLQQAPDTTVAIMTVNLESGFAFKAKLCGKMLDGLPVRVVATNKGTLLATEWQTAITYGGRTYGSALVIDDSAPQIEAVPNRQNIHRIQIVREGQRYPATADPQVRVVSSLDDVR